MVQFRSAEKTWLLLFCWLSRCDVIYYFSTAEHIRSIKKAVKGKDIAW